MNKGNELVNIIEGDKTADKKPNELFVALNDESSSELRVDYLHAYIDKLNEEIEGLRQDRLQRKIFGYIIFGFMCIYMLSVLVIVYFIGFDVAILSDKVIITLLTTSLASVIGVFNFVAKYLFPNKKSE